MSGNTLDAIANGPRVAALNWLRPYQFNAFLNVLVGR